MTNFEDQDDNESESGFGIVLSDTLIQYLLIVMCLFTIILLQPHGKKISDSHMLGAICVELSWPNERDVDLDLWGHSPGSPNTVGYSNMHDEHLNLYRDVTGFNHNPTHNMIEVMCSDQIIPGEWTFNVHYFTNHESTGSMPDDPRNAITATMMVTIHYDNKSIQSNERFMGTFTLTKVTQEKTMFDFIIGSDGKLIKDSINSNDKNLTEGSRRS